MPVYEYRGYDGSGARATGAIDADDERAARIKLRAQGILVSDLALDSGSGGGFLKSSALDSVRRFFSARVSSKEITNFTRQLATLRSAGIPLVEALDTLKERASSIGLSRIIVGARSRLVEGASLHSALSAYPSAFDPVYLSLVKAGEESGALGVTLERLADLREKWLERRAKFMTALIYPFFMLLVGVGSLFFLLVYVTPKVETMFENMGSALPLATRVLLWTSRFVTGWWPYMLIVLCIGLIALFRWGQTVAGRRAIDRFIFHAPLMGRLISSAAISRFARTLATLLDGGAGLIESLRVTALASGNSLIAAALDDAIERISAGATIVEPLKDSALFPPMALQMIRAGEKTGQLPAMLSRIADTYDFEVESSIATLIAALEPILILLIGSIVAFMTLAILLPIFELSEIIG